MEMATELLEDECRRRAMEQSDLLMIFMLKARRPHIYNRKQPVVRSCDPNNPIAVHHTDTNERAVFYSPENGRNRPEESAHVAPTIEGEIAGEYTDKDVA